MMTKTNYLTLVLTAIVLSFCACTSTDNPTIPKEEEEDDMEVMIEEQLLGRWVGQVINTTYPDTNRISFFLRVEDTKLLGTLALLDVDSDGVGAVPISKDHQDRVRVQELKFSNDTLSFRTDSVAICISGAGGDPELVEKAIEVLQWEAVVTDTLLSGSFKGTRIFVGPSTILSCNSYGQADK
ncbi:hypothetical protein GWO43_11390 [candidate division KSB1 bacterium]|nr:hypothetical protein [candidate division KSB1 bacterium]NIR70606.1 hypothetical protein [candidate division KSB1 bacterium]NIS24551.1 hypothetical protein [candidate division KSB1 bacterium]NIT71469.1 hypothetical protein [candidate division KSB1 bacterium]NIU25160.1 hypothetical protein [candidate division KSB1 bacterium]